MYNTFAERDAAVAKAKEHLRKQIELNDSIAKANDAYYRDTSLGIKKVPPIAKTAEEELTNSSLQRSRALKSLKTVLKENDAVTVLNRMAPDEVIAFNRFAEPFLKAIAGQKNLTEISFLELLRRYQDQVLTPSDNTGLLVPAQRGEYDARFEELTDPLNRHINLMRDFTLKLLGDSSKRLDMEFELAYQKKEGKSLNAEGTTLLQNVPSNTDTISNVADWQVIPKRPPIVDGKYVGLWRMRKDIGFGMGKFERRPNEMIQYIIFATFGVPLGHKIEWTGNPKTARMAATNIGALSKAKSRAESTIRPTLPEGKADEGDDKEGSGISSDHDAEQPWEPFTKRAKFATNFGRYVIGPSALKKGFMWLRYPSGASVSRFPKRMISTTLQRILSDIIYESRYEEADYQKLSNIEKQVFDDLLSVARVDKKDGLKMYKHKKYSDKARDEMIDRFNILKGELLAGNDAPSILKELKLLMIRMEDQQIISRPEMNKIIYQLALGTTP